MENKKFESAEGNEKRATISSSGDLKEFEDHIKLSGSAKISGGTLKKSIKTSGSAKIEGNLECDGFISSGSLRGFGDIIAHGEIISSGSFRILGSLNGDNNASFSGSTKIGSYVQIKGHLKCSGSFRTKDDVEVEQVITFSGSTKIEGNLTSQNVISIDGSTNIDGNIVAEDVLLGTAHPKANLFSLYKPKYKVHGNIFAKNLIDIIRTTVDKDIKGRIVRVGKGSEIIGTVYYVNNIEIHKKAKLANKPIQIKLANL